MGVKGKITTDYTDFRSGSFASLRITDKNREQPFDLAQGRRAGYGGEK
jgi:hypothetical protein